MNDIQTRPGVIVIEGHVQGLSNTRSLGEAGIPVIVIDSKNCLARYSKYCTKYFKCPDFNSESFISFLIDLGEKKNLYGWMLLPSNDHAVYNIARNQDLLEKIYKTNSPGLSVIENIYNKEKLIRCSNITGVPVADSWFPINWCDLNDFKLGFPVLVKGKFGLTFYKKVKKKAFLIHSREELEYRIKELKLLVNPEEFFIQELIPASNEKTISFSALCINGDIKSFWMGAKIREHPSRFGTSTYSKSITEPQLIPLAGNLLKELKYTGICEVEFLLDHRDGLFKLIEINARTWLWVGLAKKCGINFPVLLYNYVNGIENIFPKTYLINKEWMHYLTDIPFSVCGLFKGEYTLKEIFISYLRRPSPAVFSRKDFLPSLAEVLLSPLFLLKR